MWQDEQMEFMDTTDTPWFWYYLADCGRWHRFEDDLDNPLRSKDIDQYYLMDSKGVLKTASSDCHSKIDFSVMLQTDLKSGRVRRIQRSYNTVKSCSCFNDCPIFWEKVDPSCPYQLIPLNELTPEYNTVADYVKNEGLLDRPFVSISRIQNMDLWELYCRKKKQLMRIHGVKDIHERRLFHGTNISNVDSICKYNFDLRLSGQHGRLYGKGIYFAKHASYADRYSVASKDPMLLYGGETRGVQGENTKIIFLARVMVGQSTVGQTYFEKPDHGSSENSHDSCVDDIDHPTMFIIFDPNQIYPEYLIQYK
ncbi:hypothetical protein L3Q82_009403 [Scortum barcoo]|uniref:Uncharacterized protein n=1 Tax=Scortum barcoo TaxID=214431 RepID=A0ACB8WFV0_9TELE|nr:hypothetical protein L3Q82_009403 [Scortum barcoo]